MTLPLLPYAGVTVLRPDPVLIVALLGLTLTAALTRILVRRGVIDSRGPAMAAALLLLAAALILCMQRTGGLFSPLVLLLGVLVTVSALLLSPLANLFAISGVCLLETLAVTATAQGHLPPGLAPPAAPSTLLLIELGFLGLAGFVVNALAWHLRVQQTELACRDLRDPETGTLRRSFFHARLVGLLEDARERGSGVGLILLDVPRAELLHQAGDLLLETVRGDDLAGRVGTSLFAVALVTKKAHAVPRIARRLVARLGSEDVRAAFAYTERPEGEPVECASKLCADAERKLHAESGFSRDSRCA
ncbi:MAG: GGDEF domain-containing protein [Planctomycetota bacterium]